MIIASRRKSLRKSNLTMSKRDQQSFPRSLATLQHEKVKRLLVSFPTKSRVRHIGPKSIVIGHNLVCSSLQSQSQVTDIFESVFQCATLPGDGLQILNHPALTDALIAISHELCGTIVSHKTVLFSASEVRKSKITQVSPGYDVPVDFQQCFA